MNPNYTTDGPWASDSEFISSPDGFIAQLVERDTPRETEANARLIASAPDLLAALSGIFDHAERTDAADLAEIWSRIDDIRNLARAAISKATGGAA